MTEISNSQTTDFLITHSNNTASDFETHILTKEAVNEQIKNYIARWAKQLEDLILLVQGMSHVDQANLPKRWVAVMLLPQQVTQKHQTNEILLLILYLSGSTMVLVDTTFPSQYIF